VLALAAIPMFAHHPFAPDFDWKKPITITGTVTKITTAEPHGIVNIDAKVGDTTSNWTVERGSPKVLARYGWPSYLVKVGDKVTVDGWQSSDGSNEVSAQTIKVPDGRTLFGASSFFDLPFRASYGKIGHCVSADVCVEMETKITQR
jgi:hypothetical protein